MKKTSAKLTAAVGIGLVAALALFTLVEATVALTARRFHPLPTVEYQPHQGLSEPEPRLGYRPSANTRIRAACTYRGTQVYDAVYTFDEFHRRRTPQKSPETRPRFVAVFGCSFAFGEGVNDDETLPSCLGRLMTSSAAYNYAFSGYGPQQAVAQLEDPGIRAQIPQHEGLGLYILIPGHVRRAIGAMRMVVTWGRDFPCYELTQDGLLTCAGSFIHARPWRTWAYRIAARETIMKASDVDWPLRLRDTDLELTCRILALARQRFVERFGSDGFRVVIYPSHPNDEFPPERLAAILRQLAISTIDLTHTLDLRERGLLFPYDLHPTAEAHRRLAEALTKDLDAAP